MTPPFEIRSYGGAMTVTGSCHLLDTGTASILVDCGTFQGSRALFDLNREPFGFDAQAIDAVLLTHAHLDHSGRLPQLVKRGFTGPVYALPATGMLCQHLLLDAAKLQYEDRQRQLRRDETPDEPLFDEDDVWGVLEAIEPIAYGEPFEVAGVRVTAQPAGHIPGSASFLVEVAGSRVVFSGDVGNARKDVLPDPTPCPEADVVLIESTYGNRDHRDFDATIDEFAEVLKEAVRRRGKILIPSFALERAQDVLFHIARLEDEGRIPVIPVYVDSPLADRVEDVYQECMDELSDEVRAIAATGRDPFAPKKLRYTQSVEDSKAINASPEACIVIAGSGMMSGGRILHHLRAHLEDTHTTVMIVGFQPKGGLGRRLVDGAREVRVLGQALAVKARVVTINGLSAHADRTELLGWSAGAGRAAHFVTVHGEPESLEALRDALAARGNTAEVQASRTRLPSAGFSEEAGE